VEAADRLRRDTQRVHPVQTVGAATNRAHDFVQIDGLVVAVALLDAHRAAAPPEHLSVSILGSKIGARGVLFAERRGTSPRLRLRTVRRCVHVTSSLAGWSAPRENGRAG